MKKIIGLTLVVVWLSGATYAQQAGTNAAPVYDNINHERQFKNSLKPGYQVKNEPLQKMQSNDNKTFLSGNNNTTNLNTRVAPAPGNSVEIKKVQPKAKQFFY